MNIGLGECLALASILDGRLVSSELRLLRDAHSVVGHGEATPDARTLDVTIDAVAAKCRAFVRGEPFDA